MMGNRTALALNLAALVVVGLALLAVKPAMRVTVDNRIERWLDSEGEDARRYEQFRERFGTDEFVLAAYSGKPFFDDAGLAAQRAALEQLESIENVHRVMGIPAVHRDLGGVGDPSVLDLLFRESPLYKNFLINEAGSMAALLVETVPPPDAAGRRRLVQDIDAALAPLRTQGYALHIVGPPVLNAVLDQTSEQETLRVFPVALICSMLMLLYLFRSVRASLVAATSAGLSILLTMGILGSSGYELNMVTAALPSLLWVLSLSNGIHVLRRYQVWRQDVEAPRRAMHLALADSARPCALSAITTALGFLSLTTATMAPVRELGIFAAVGMMLSLLVNLSLGPAFAVLIRVPAVRQRKGMLDAMADFAARLVGRYPRWILGVSVAGVLLAAASISQIRVESDPMEFLERDSVTVRDYQAVSEHLTGTYSLELVVETPGGWDNLDYAAALDALARTLEAQPGVARVMSPTAQASSPAPPALPSVAQASPPALLAAANADLERLVTPDGETLRMSVLISAMDSGSFTKILDAAEDALRALPAPLEGYATGIVPRLVEAQLDLVSTQLRSFGLAFVVVFGCIWVGLRSFKLMAVSILPNLLPILAAFSAMAAMGTALDAGTVMVASVALGIAVDDTVHLLEVFRSGVRRGLDARAATLDAVLQVGPAMILTTATACAGFFALGRSHFVPIAYFGLLSGIALIVALAADLLLTPALLLPLRSKQNEVSSLGGASVLAGRDLGTAK